MIRQFFWLILVVAAAAGFYSWQLLEQDNKTAPETQDNQPDYVAVNLTRMIYDEQGHLSDLIRAQRMEHFERFGFLQFDFPIYTIYQQKVPLWQVTSEQAVLYPDDKLILEHRVELRNMSPDPLFTRIETNAVELVFNTNTLQSNEQVRIFGLGFQITGKGMLADLDEQNIELKQHTKTVYYNEK
ncbi:LPS export ABC transporter periplasmic protein LptC [Rheinheimera sediminis]|uniref:LPS export ABC transporter periplasmic protein LptC n=1 Tax=Rheinheimera sp. YQF-1 TaxID=2499626 RepID=UPI000FD90B20|nr:LPS export ABC transporter periplasmic protein LptC [Rheinheimera sp. YQF-1]RVT48274.1 LPS export ABC transporter periplasmic protein LptC [Rheinheimera sp. YQF-1]